MHVHPGAPKIETVHPIFYCGCTGATNYLCRVMYVKVLLYTSIQLILDMYLIVSVRKNNKIFVVVLNKDFQG